MTNTITAKEAATLRRLDRKIMSGKKVSRAEIDLAISLKRKKGSGASLGQPPRFQNIVRALEDDAADIWEWGRDTR